MQQVEKNKLVKFTWNMLYDCNYRCPYCFFEGKWDEYKKRNIYLSVDEWMSCWIRMHNRYGYLYILMTGGEPFIYPDFIELVSRLSEISYHINISSNGSGDLEGFVKKIKSERVSLSLSFQPEFDKLDSFIDKVSLIRDYGLDGCINFVAYPPYIKDIERYVSRFTSIGEKLKIIPFWGRYNKIDYPNGYTPEENRLIGINDAWLERIRKKGTLCDAGFKTALIFPDGKVGRCGQIGEKLLLGNFLDRNFKLLPEALFCDAEYCPCDEGNVLAE